MAFTTFTAGTKAKSSEVNANFNQLWSHLSRLQNSSLGLTQEAATISSAASLTSGKVYRFGNDLTISDTLTLSGGIAGVPTIIVVDGDFTLSGTITATSYGFAAGGGGTGGSSPTTGDNGDDNTSIMSWMSKGNGAGIGGGHNGQSPGTAVTFSQFTTEPVGLSSIFNCLSGSGGGGGGGGGGASTGTGDGGGGGIGGGCVIIICTGTFDGTGGTINVSGTAGTNGEVGVSDIAGGGGGGGGSGGTIIIGYGGSYTAPTLTVAAGAGGSGAAGAGVSNGGAGGSGGGGQSGTASTAGIAHSTTTGGAGGAGSVGKAYAINLIILKGWWDNMWKEKLLKWVLSLFYTTRVPGKTKKISPGLKKDDHDKRDYKVEYAQDQKVPLHYQLPINAYNFVKNQGKWNSCASHAMSTGLEITYELKDSNKKDVELSERFHYYMTRLRTGKLPKNVGMTMRDMLKTAQRNGICPEKLCPYISSEMNKPPGPFTESFAKWFKVRHYMRITSIEDIKKTLLNQQVVLVGVQINESFKRYTGDIYVADKERLYGGHAITVIGYDEVNEWFVCINSWDNDYKDKGLMYVPYDYFNKYCFDMWTYTISD